MRYGTHIKMDIIYREIIKFIEKIEIKIHKFRIDRYRQNETIIIILLLEKKQKEKFLPYKSKQIKFIFFIIYLFIHCIIRIKWCHTLSATHWDSKRVLHSWWLFLFLFLKMLTRVMISRKKFCIYRTSK